MNISTALNSKRILVVAIVTATFLGNNCYGQSFMQKAKAKAAAAKKGTTTPTKSNGTSAKGPKSGSSTYYLMEAERGGVTKVKLEEGENNGTKIMAINGAMYTYQDEPSSTLGIKVYYTSAGLYVIQHDDNSWVSVMPGKELGREVFDKFGFSNFYSTDAAKAKEMTKVKVEAYAIEMSKKMLAPSTSGPSKGGDGTYHLSEAANIDGKRVTSHEVSFEDGAIKTLIAGSKFTYMEEYSKLIGVDVYGISRAWLKEYIYVYKPGVLIWSRLKKSQLGEQEAGEYDDYNVYAMDKQVARGIAVDKSQQKEITDKLTKWINTIKASEDKRRASNTKEKIAKQRLPKEGLVISSLKGQTLDAAKAWAKKWNWKETVTKAYLTDADWYIYRHKLTGVILRREIRGVMVLQRPDGGCSFHHCVYGQQYNGSTYNKVYTAGITPGQVQLPCENSK